MKRVLTLVLLTGSFVLLLSMGGAIVAAPVSLPLLVAVARADGSRLIRGVAVLLAVLTALEAVWALVYVTLGESRPWIWLVPAVTTAALLGILAPLVVGARVRNA